MPTRAVTTTSGHGGHSPVLPHVEVYHWDRCQPLDTLRSTGYHYAIPPCASGKCGKHDLQGLVAALDLVRSTCRDHGLQQHGDGTPLDREEQLVHNLGLDRLDLPGHGGQT